MDSGSSTPLANVVAAWNGRGVVAVVDLDTIATNIKTLRSLIGPSVQLMAVVKANGYGHEAIPVAKTALESGADALGVATVDEGAQLRTAGIDEPILVFGAIGNHERASAIGHGLSIIVTNPAFADALAADARASLAKEPVSVHLKLDTGMRRFGAMPAEVVELAKSIAAHPQLRLDGLMTHLASADAVDTASAVAQVAEFDACVDALQAAGVEIPVHHVANSAATLRFPEFHKQMVRVGIASYGLIPDPNVPLPGPMKPALTVHGKVARVFELAAGDAIGYGGTYSSPGNERAALVTIGYADGYRRALSSEGWMAIRGQRADILGRVSMDQTVIRVPQGLEIAEGEPVVVVGDGTARTAGAPTIDELAAVADTIGYELATGLARRLTRLFVRGGQVVAIADLAGYRELS